MLSACKCIEKKAASCNMVPVLILSVCTEQNSFHLPPNRRKQSAANFDLD